MKPHFSSLQTLCLQTTMLRSRQYSRDKSISRKKSQSPFRIAGKNSKTESKIDSIIGKVKKDISEKCQKRKTLREVDLIVLDNSIRESTVGQLRGHTLGCFMWLLKVGSEEIGSSPCKCFPLLSLIFVEIKKSYT